VSNSQVQVSGERFGRYVLLECIGRGGMAECYRAVAHGLEGFKRVFVIKRILKDKSDTPEFVEMFVTEARVSALLNHPNIVQIYDFGQIDGSYFLAMEHLRGKDLLSVLRQQRVVGEQVLPEVAAYICQQVALGLDYAHKLTHAGKNLKIVHRDVSPSNIMLLRAGGVKLLDFGIAKAAMELRADNDTQAGLVKGKLSYVSPEQIRGASDIDGRADIFALGVVLWETLTGKRLFFDKNDFQTMRNVMERPVPPPSTQRAEIPAALDFIVLRALEREVDKRYPDARTMADELEAVLQEARFAPRAMISMLDTLFGEESPQVELATSSSSLVPLVDLETQPLPLASEQPTTTLPPEAPQQIGSSDEDLFSGVSSVRRLPTMVQARAPLLAAAAAIVLVVTGGAVLVGNARRRSMAEEEAPKAAGTAFTPAEPAAIVEPIVAPTKTAPPAPTAPKPVVMPIVPAKVTVRIDSDPQGAEVASDKGRHLGTTPTMLMVPRSPEPLSIVVSKPGYVSSRQAIVPDRDVSALLTLRAEEEPKRRAPPPKRRHAAGGDNRVREGLSIDPFAEDPRPRR
jgi:eukaryotic-like serine/threonine-protein kinase